MTHSIALNFEDGVTRFVEARPGETIADASYRLGINIPLDCRDGACGTCKCRVESGSFDGGSYIEDALTDEEAASGLALACQARPKTDLVVAIPAASTACKTRPQSFPTVLRGVERLSDTSLAFTLDRPVGLAFLPGQYVNLGVPGTEQRRSYSFSSAPGADTLSFLVRDIPGGLMSGWLRAAEAGMAMEFTGPSGSFYLRDVTRPVLFLAGGTGLAPFLSMLGRLAEAGCAQPLRLVYGVTNDADLVGLEELEAYAARLPDFSFVTIVAAEGSAHPRKGYVTAHVEPAWLNGGDVDVYLCGPPPMVEAVRSWLGANGVTPAAFHFEKFSPSGNANGGKLAA
ncbi:benzoate 1,2-dioxygenase electron transfer component BenC [Neoroseomonas oryzicola]|uniref:Ring-hydroxylating dioxygenase ferredoxin reductase family protein n=1 Tax=Neoroseomonas oryzicola TaxID=535904 RepID=A0A9X9WQ01_9PROT|nr:benzoate 1,2-dioxygenase electron transfer component BenC [Neoroseomonas oryzicola]MBR0662411.1 ring-hydroxylating dioxygenase ferredoxin reductase family protein [Neoroseomonas oryzicola]NKE20305.1 ring-hydroxylating dioxygenase ferredoxin reductase family protein [Neoroseomonas oryzicola]